LLGEAGSRKQEAGSRKQEAGSRKQEAGSYPFPAWVASSYQLPFAEYIFCKQQNKSLWDSRIDFIDFIYFISKGKLPATSYQKVAGSW
jgi:hypothetical protein